MIKVVDTCRQRSTAHQSINRSSICPQPHPIRMERRKSLVAIGSALVDIHKNVDEKFLLEWNLNSNDAIPYDEKFAKLFSDLLQDPDVIFRPGGCVFNSLKTCKGLSPEFSCTFIGASGDDKPAQMLIRGGKEAGINIELQVNSNESTGACAVLLNSTNRSLITYQGASALLNLEFMRSRWNLINDAEVFYIVGFVLKFAPEVVKMVSAHASHSGKTFCFNLSAPFICRNFSNLIMEILPNCDYVFCNSDELKALTETLGMENNLEGAAQYISCYRANHPRTIIMSAGSSPVTVVCGDEITLFDVPKIEKNNITTTNGAGDALAGGVLSGILKNVTMAEAVNSGIQAASALIQTVPGNTLINQ